MSLERTRSLPRYLALRATKYEGSEVHTGKQTLPSDLNIRSGWSGQLGAHTLTVTLFSLVCEQILHED